MTKELYAVLTRYKDLKCEIQDISILIEEIETQLLPSGVRYDKEAVQKSPNDFVTELMLKDAELIRKKSEKAEEAYHAMTRIYALIDKLDQPERLLMKYRWISCLEWNEIAERIEYSVDWCYKHNRIALEKLEDFIG